MNAALATENERLRQKVVALQSALSVKDEYLHLGVSLGLTRSEAVVFGLLISRSVVSDATYSAARSCYDEIDPGCLKVLVYRMRRKLPKGFIDIIAVRGVGYRLSAADRSRIAASLGEEAAAAGIRTARAVGGARP